MNRLYKKEEVTEIIFEFPAAHFDKLELEKEIVKFYERIEKWKNLYDVEVGYVPKEEKDECSWYTMPKIIIKHSLEDSIDGILKHEPAHRNKIVDEWIMYYKITLKNGNIIRNIDSLYKIFNRDLNEKMRDLIKDALKSKEERTIIIE